MSDQVTNAVVAVALGSVLAVLLFIPVAAVQYRLDGRLGPGDLTTLFAGAVYALAIWTYTLLPMPRDHTFACQGTQLRVFGTLRLISVPDHGGPVALLREPAFLQVVLNVLLFVPLGYLVRVIAHRGVLVATLFGLAVSVLVELTQKTGDWHLYSCAYRLFDVDDIIVNTLGATIGSLVSRLVVHTRRPEVVLPTTISLGRRLVGFTSDVVFILLTGTAAALAWRAYEVFGRGHRGAQVDHHVQNLLQWGLPLVVEIALVVGFGRTVGELIVSLHTEPRIRRLLLGSRVLKLVFGVGPLFLLPLFSGVIAYTLLAAYAVVTVAAAARTRDHRGLSHVVGHLDLRIGDDAVVEYGRDDDEPAAPSAATSAS